MRFYFLAAAISAFLMGCKDHRAALKVERLEKEVERLQLLNAKSAAKIQKLADQVLALTSDPQLEGVATQPKRFKFVYNKWDSTSHPPNTNSMTAGQVRRYLAGKWLACWPSEQITIGVGQGGWSKGLKRLWTFSEKGAYLLEESEKYCADAGRTDGYEFVSKGAALLTRHEYLDTGGYFWVVELEPSGASYGSPGGLERSNACFMLQGGRLTFSPRPHGELMQILDGGVTARERHLLRQLGDSAALDKVR